MEKYILLLFMFLILFLALKYFNKNIEGIANNDEKQPICTGTCNGKGLIGGTLNVAINAKCGEEPSKYNKCLATNYCYKIKTIYPDEDSKWCFNDPDLQDYPSIVTAAESSIWKDEFENLCKPEKCLENCSDPISIDGNCGDNIYTGETKNYKKCRKMCSSSADEINTELEARERGEDKSKCTNEGECRPCTKEIIFDTEGLNTQVSSFDDSSYSAGTMSGGVDSGLRGKINVVCGPKIDCPCDKSKSSNCCGEYVSKITYDAAVLGAASYQNSLEQEAQSTRQSAKNTFADAISSGAGAGAGAGGNWKSDDANITNVPGQVADPTQVAGSSNASSTYNNNEGTNSFPENTSESKTDEYGGGLLKDNNADVDCKTYPNHPKCTDQTNNMFGCVTNAGKNDINSMGDPKTLDSSWGLFK
jgi:hypothetical protein